MNRDPDNLTHSPVPAAAEKLFRMCWQLENWLRLIVYVELRAHRIDWEVPIQTKVRDWPPRSLASDKRLHHMATSHEASLSYLTFGQLWDVISSDDTWELFAPYFPPKENVAVKIDEIRTIRNRTAHFREPHSRDAARLGLFLGDMEPGIRRFCNRYTQELIPRDPSGDLVSTALEAKWERLGYGIELMRPNGWLYAPGSHRERPLLNGRLAMLVHATYSPETLAGLLYRVTVQRGNQTRKSDTASLFDSTKPLHADFVHFMIASFGDEVSITIPAILGVERVTELAAAFLRAGLEATRGSAPSVDLSKRDWPEYVLLPTHIINNFDDGSQEPILVIE